MREKLRENVRESLRENLSENPRENLHEILRENLHENLHENLRENLSEKRREKCEQRRENTVPKTNMKNEVKNLNEKKNATPLERIVQIFSRCFSFRFSSRCSLSQRAPLIPPSYDGIWSLGAIFLRFAIRFRIFSSEALFVALGSTLMPQETRTPFWQRNEFVARG